MVCHATEQTDLHQWPCVARLAFSEFDRSTSQVRARVKFESRVEFESRHFFCLMFLVVLFLIAV